MLKSLRRPAIRLKGVRHNNLKNFDLDLPLNQLIVITGLSGSGKSSLAFDTLFAEGQRRYIETFSPYARQFFDRMDKPQVDRIEGIPPAIAIEQRNSVKTTRSTVGTMTEICDYMKVLWPHVARLHCRQCAKPVRKDHPEHVWKGLLEQHPGAAVLVTFDLPLSERLSPAESLQLVAKQGYQRVLINGEIVRVENALASRVQAPPPLTHFTVVQDRVSLEQANRSRFIEACEQAYHFGKGKLSVRVLPSEGAAQGSASVLKYSKGLHCAHCDIDYPEPTPALFSFNHPLGACPACKGFGRVIGIDYSLAVPDRTRTISQGVVKPWLSGQSADCQADLLRMCRQVGIPLNQPFERLPEKWQKLIMEGEPGYGSDEEHTWPAAWYGVKGYFAWLESRAYKMHVRVLLSRYRTYTRCPQCEGQRFQPGSLLYLAEFGAPPRKMTLADFYQLPARDALEFIETLQQQALFSENRQLRIVLEEVRCRLHYLVAVGLGYLTLDRPTRSLSGGETERVNLTSCLGTRLVNTLFVLDEPSVGLHPRDTDRLVTILQQLRDSGNTVVVVEHEPAIMRAADSIVDLGPGHGESGGEVVYQGSYSGLLSVSGRSLTGAYLSGRKAIEIPARRPVHGLADDVATGARLEGTMSLQEAHTPFRSHSHDDATVKFLTVSNATRHNLKNVTVSIPLGRFVCITGVSGSGKSTLIRDVLLPALTEKLKASPQAIKAADAFVNEETDQDKDTLEAASPVGAELEGWQGIQQVVMVEQSSLGKTPRSNPAVYIGAFEHMRDFFAQSPAARQKGLNSSAFSFNSAQGQCERCRGAGFEKVEMQFLSDIFIRCPDCRGRRYRREILEVKVQSPSGGSHDGRSFSIADLLDATVDEALGLLEQFVDSRGAKAAVERLALLQEVGLGYLKTGQPINTLSGGESQRLKLVRHLAEIDDQQAPRAMSTPRNKGTTSKPSMLFMFDEPTTGLHFEDVAVLLRVFQRLVNAGHSLLVIEHNLEVIKTADWLIDLGPEAGDQGGRLVAQGTPEQVAATPGSHTGAALASVLNPRRSGTSKTAARKSLKDLVSH